MKTAEERIPRRPPFTDEALDGGLAALCRTLLSERARLVEAVSTERRLRRGQLAAVARRLRRLQQNLRHEQTQLQSELENKDLHLRLEQERVSQLEQISHICRKCKCHLTDDELREINTKGQIGNFKIKSIEELLKTKSLKNKFVDVLNQTELKPVDGDVLQKKSMEKSSPKQQYSPEKTDLFDVKLTNQEYNKESSLHMKPSEGFRSVEKLVKSIEKLHNDSFNNSPPNNSFKMKPEENLKIKSNEESKTELLKVKSMEVTNKKFIGKPSISPNKPNVLDLDHNEIECKSLHDMLKVNLSHKINSPLNNNCNDTSDRIEVFVSNAKVHISPSNKLQPIGSPKDQIPRSNIKLSQTNPNDEHITKVKISQVQDSLRTSSTEKIIPKVTENSQPEELYKSNNSKPENLLSRVKISETIPSEFEEEGEGWYAQSGAGSDVEDDPRNDVYRNNPVLECCNQILLRNVRDGAASPVPPVATTPPKTTTAAQIPPAYMEPRPPASDQYYETPIHFGNFYESLHSSTHYEQIQHGSERTYQSTPTPRRGDYVEMEVRRGPPPALPPKPVGGLVQQSLVTTAKGSSGTGSEPDYCSISELNLPHANVENVERVQLAGVAHIPKLPQVSEIIIPEDDPSPDTKKHSPGSISISADNYVRNNSALRAARHIATARSVSSLLGAGASSAATTMAVMSPTSTSSMGATSGTLRKQEPVKYQLPAFDLSQTFEEFKLDECELGEEEENIPDAPKHLHLPDSPPVAPIYSLPPAYEHFLECTGLSSKSLISTPRPQPTPRAPPPPLRPKDVKMRSRFRLSLGSGPQPVNVKFQQ